jgi:hypothetical protein
LVCQLCNGPRKQESFREQEKDVLQEECAPERNRETIKYFLPIEFKDELVIN